MLGKVLSKFIFHIIIITLAIIFFNHAVFAQENWSVIYQEDFDDNVINSWSLNSAFSIVSDNGNNILYATQNAWGTYDDGYLLRKCLFSIFS